MAMQVHITIDAALVLAAIRNFGVAGFNFWVSQIERADMLGAVWAEGERPPSLAIYFDVSYAGSSLRGRSLDGVDLETAWASGVVDCRQSSFRAAKLGFPGDFRGSDLTRAKLIDVSAAVFDSSTRLRDLDRSMASYDPDRPPVGLPPELLAVCRAEAEQPRTGGKMKPVAEFGAVEIHDV